MRQPADQPAPEEPETAPAPTPAAATDANGPTDLSAAQLVELQDEWKQAEYRRQYLLQLEQRRGCPGCGD